MAKSIEERKAERATTLERGFTTSQQAFSWLVKNTRRTNIVAEGDSWFAYPGSNILSWFRRATEGTSKVNILSLASSGDEATSMLSGKQKFRLAKILNSTDRVHVVLFSGGGNDIVGRWDMDRLLNQFELGSSALDCIRIDRLERKLKRISLAYSELLEIRNDHSPETLVVTHTYDIPSPTGVAAEFAFGVIKKGPWIGPYLNNKKIPRNLHEEVCKIVFEKLSECLKDVSNGPEANGRMVTVDTQGTLNPGEAADWQNEIHPSKSGFRKIASKIYCAVQEKCPELPEFPDGA